MNDVSVFLVVVHGVKSEKIPLQGVADSDIICDQCTLLYGAGTLFLAPLSTMTFLMENTPEGAGMGTSGLVGQIFTLTAMGFEQAIFLKIGLLHIAGPAILSYIIYLYLRKKEWIKPGDMTIPKGQ